MTSLALILGISVPVIQAPMAGAQDSALAIAAAKAGALGSLPCAMLTPDALRRELATIRATTDEPVNVNFFCHTAPAFDATRDARWRESLSDYYLELKIDASTAPAGASRRPFGAESLEILREFRPEIVSFHFGLPPPELLSPLREWNAKIFSSATTVDEAVWLEQRGVDAVIAQGLEAGGHRGHFLTDDLTAQLSTFTLVPQIARRIRVPVIAAGGIADRAGIAAALQLGAAAVQIGTAFLLCPETTISAPYRVALKSDAARHTAITNVFSGRPARGIVNRLMRERGPMSDLAPEFPLASAAIAPLRAAAEARGQGDFSSLWSGQNTTGCKEIPAADLIREWLN